MDLTKDAYVEVISRSVTTTAASDVIVVAYNLVVRNPNPGICGVGAGVAMDGGAMRRQTGANLQQGISSLGQTVMISPGSVGTHTIRLKASANCEFMTSDATPLGSFGEYGTTMTTMVLKQ